jgi:hypothetical protein
MGGGGSAAISQKGYQKAHRKLSSMSSPKLVFEMTEEEALKYGLITCACGHPKNNHFGEDEPCAHCNCKKYNPVPRVGTMRKKRN